MNSVELIYNATNNTNKAFEQLISDVKRTADNVEKMAGRSNQALERMDKKAATTSNSFGRSVSVMAGKFLILETTINHVARILDTFVFDFNSTLETAQLGIASAFLTGGEYVDNFTGKVLTGSEALKAARDDAKDMVAKLQASNLQTIATTQQLIRAYQETLPVAMAKGFNRDQVEAFTVAVVQAAGSIGVQLDMLGEETRSLLTGAIDPKASRIAMALGLRPADIAKYKDNANDLFNFLMDKLSAYSEAGVESQKTWAGVSSNAIDLFKQMTAKLSEPLFEGVKADLKEMTDKLGTVNEVTREIEWNQEFLDQVQTLQRGIGSIYTLLKNVSGILSEVGGEAGTAWLNMISGVSALLEATNKLNVNGNPWSPTLPGMEGLSLFNKLVDYFSQEEDYGKRYPMPKRPSQSTYNQKTPVEEVTPTKVDEKALWEQQKNSALEKYMGDISRANHSSFFDETAKRTQAATLSMDEFTEAQTKAAEEYQRMMEILKASLDEPMSPWLEGATKGLQTYVDYASDLTDNLENTVVSAFSGMEDALVEFAATGKMSFSDLVDSILTDITRLVIQQSVTGPIANALISGLSSMFGGSSINPAGYNIPGAAAVASANGNVFSGAGISAYSGSIVAKPTLFPFANGIGLMGEAGPEGIFPLTRVNGKLGIRAEGSGGTEIRQTVHNHFDMRDYTSEQRLQQVISIAAEEGSNRAYQKVIKDVDNRGPIYRKTRG